MPRCRTKPDEVVLARFATALPAALAAAALVLSADVLAAGLEAREGEQTAPRHSEGAGDVAVTAAESDSLSYPLDEMPRVVPERGRLRCPDLDFVRYSGDLVRYHAPVKVFRGFAERLRRFEAVVVEVATQVYGRAPRRLVHMGTYNCRRIRGWPQLLSEHALGNAIDVMGFDFGALRKAEPAPDGLPRSLRAAFQVRLEKHWTASARSSDAATLHAEFLRTLARRLIARDDVFRVLLGPAYPGHHDHFHFDMAPYPMVDVF